MTRPGKRHLPPQIVRKLRGVDATLSTARHDGAVRQILEVK